mmetsp:Transcript_14775/g.22325  ORF Transcript_14775/g.22325 Transcript_14775/m.22325 type:complete len:200 (+) Transcript_14775:892-1491(+)
MSYTPQEYVHAPSLTPHKTFTTALCASSCTATTQLHLASRIPHTLPTPRFSSPIATATGRCNGPRRAAVFCSQERVSMPCPASKFVLRRPPHTPKSCRRLLSRPMSSTRAGSFSTSTLAKRTRLSLAWTTKLFSMFRATTQQAKITVTWIVARFVCAICASPMKSKSNLYPLRPWSLIFSLRRWTACLSSSSARFCSTW